MCLCSKLPDIFRLDAHPEIERQAPEIAAGDFATLHQCSTCGETWRIDDWDKLQLQFVVRIPDGSDWQAFDASELGKLYLVSSRGGLKDVPCQWAGCNRPQVKGDVVYCVEHLHESGARD